MKKITLAEKLRKIFSNRASPRSQSKKSKTWDRYKSNKQNRKTAKENLRKGLEE